MIIKIVGFQKLKSHPHLTESFEYHCLIVSIEALVAVIIENVEMKESFDPFNKEAPFVSY